MANNSVTTGSVCQYRLLPNNSTECIAFPSFDECDTTGRAQKVAFSCVFNGTANGFGVSFPGSEKLDAGFCKVNECKTRGSGSQRLSRTGLIFLAMLFTATVLVS